MSKPILQLQNSANWQAVWDGAFTSVKLADGSSEFIPPIVVPTLFESNIISVYCISQTAKPSWSIAGNVARKISTGILPPDENFESTIADVRLLRLKQFNLFRFQRLTDYYKLEIRPKYWIEDLSIYIFAYTGIDTDTVTEQLGRIEAAVDAINQ
jgi:hypothetical protein